MIRRDEGDAGLPVSVSAGDADSEADRGGPSRSQPSHRPIEALQHPVGSDAPGAASDHVAA